MAKRIGLPTSGGECGGSNAADRAVALRAVAAYGWEMPGIRNGSIGLRRGALERAARGLGICLGDA